MKAKSAKSPQFGPLTDAKNEILGLGKHTLQTLGDDSLDIGEDFFRQLFGLETSTQKTLQGSTSGEVNFRQQKSGEIKLETPAKVQEKQAEIANFYAVEAMIAENKARENQQIVEIQMVVKSLQAEVGQVAKQVGKDTNLPLEYMPAPGTYHINFLENVLKLLKSALGFVRGARRDIDNSGAWLLASTGRKKRGPLGVGVWTKGKQMKVHEHASMAILQG